MRYQSFGSLSVLAILATGPMLLPEPARAQDTAAKSAKPFTPPKTQWGDPDLQGVWPSTNLIGTPMQRDSKLGTRAVLNDAELKQRQQVRDAEEEFDTAETVSDKTRCDPNNPASRIPGASRGDGAAPKGEVYATCGTNGVTIGPPLYWDERGQPNRQASLIVDPPNGRLPAMTPDAQKAQQERAAVMRAHMSTRGATDTWTDRGLKERCVSWGPAVPTPSGYDSGNQIVQGPGYVMLTVEKVHETRLIPLDGSPHAGPGLRSWQGDSRGHWEGNTLVVDTTNYNNEQEFAGTITSDQLHLVERFTLVDAKTLRYEATVTDPKTWTAPWKMAFELKKDPTYKVYEYACHEANYFMYNMLTGARAEEERAAAAAQRQK